MLIRAALLSDIPSIQIVRNAVKENMLSDPALVTDQDCAVYMSVRGKGWVCIADDHIVGFSIVDLMGHNVWALFVHPDYDKRGIGRQLHDIMLNWYFHNSKDTIWLGTAPGTRAAAFYRKAGWIETGRHGKGEIKFEMPAEKWQQINPL